MYSLMIVVEEEFMKDLFNLKKIITWEWDCSFAIRSRGRWGKCG